jgi:hypothetical protein
MTKQTLSTAAASIAVLLTITFSAQASPIGMIVVTPTFDLSNQTQFPDTSDYESVPTDGTAAPYDLTIGAFNFNIPAGDTVYGATIFGTFGDVNYTSSALADLYVLGGTIKVGGCDLNPDSSYPFCATNQDPGALVSWSYTFSSSDLANLATDFAHGSIDFTAVQNSAGVTVIGTPTLDISTVPEPASIFAAAAGLLAFAAFRRRS